MDWKSRKWIYTTENLPDAIFTSTALRTFSVCPPKSPPTIPSTLSPVAFVRDETFPCRNSAREGHRRTNPLGFFSEGGTDYIPDRDLAK